AVDDREAFTRRVVWCGQTSSEVRALRRDGAGRDRLVVLDLLAHLEAAKHVRAAVAQSPGAGAHLEHALGVLLPRALLVPKARLLGVGDRERTGDGLASVGARDLAMSYGRVTVPV